MIPKLRCSVKRANVFSIFAFSLLAAAVAEKNYAEHLKPDKREDRGGDGESVKPGCRRHADSRRDPDAGRRGKPVDGLAVDHDRSGADETDSAHDLRRDATGVALPSETVLRDEQHKRRTERYK